ncbi:flagellar filament capping protein FliD [Nocardioides sp. URHA0020]|uniref:flagellar filament capping protein FliD n=1 Tax=Nocardioides sp. URHA0020 TaxID=1380392 RepID=UPI00048B382F|nr:flagellar filament capping protein FliD [Nocardioides sp. URHA0020]
MAGASSISGLSSGLNTADIVDQLMQLEAVSQTRLQTQQNSEKSVQTALRALNTNTSVLASKAEALGKPATWQTLKATVTGTGVTAAATSSASASSFSVTVDRLAKTHQVALTDTAALTDVVAGSSIKLTTNDGTVHAISTGGGTLKEVAAAINAKSTETGVSATTVKVADGSYRLLTESTATGAKTSFTLTKGDGTALLGGSTVRAGEDAQISLGVGITATSSTNTFADITPGVTLTLAASATIGSAVSVKVAQDPSSVSSSVSDLVDQVNQLLTTIDSQTATKSDTAAAGVLVGDPTARTLRNQLLETVFGGTGSMSALGIQTDRYGKLVFNADTFKTAYAADPAAVAAKFTAGATPAADGWAARVARVTKAASNSTTGTITSAINGHTSSITTLGKGITDWDDRLALRRESLERQYTALETALSSLQSQSSWLSSQIASLPTYS